jgi:hypothetical protein
MFAYHITVYSLSSLVTSRNNVRSSAKSRDTNAANKIKIGAFVRQRTVPTERPPLVGEVSANFSG